ncbi:MAG TPA: lysophospholipid acyltransferase family protein, partial [Dehalococcoidia bacterium]|nr:lysophospholipid acyltransferase family protein [Dehalococcoidia bacterium]
TIGRLPLRARYAIADFVADRVYQLAPGIRASLRHNMRLALGPGAPDDAIDRAARRAARHTAYYYADLVGFPRMDLDEFSKKRLVIEGVEDLRAAAATGKGVVLASTHYGNPELAVQGLAPLGIRVFALTEPLQPRQLSDLTHRLREAHGHIYRTASFDGVKEAIRRLRSGEIVAVLFDRDIQGTGILVPFRGRLMRVPTGVIDLALRTGAIVFPAMVRRTGRYTLHAKLGPAMPLTVTGDRDRDLRENLTRLMAIFEQHLAADPGQWTVVERIWYEDPPPARSAIENESPATPAVQ